MMYLAVKAALSGVIIAAVSEIAKRNPGLGALVASLPLVSILAMMWLWRDTRGADCRACGGDLLAGAAFVAHVPPRASNARRSVGFWPSLGASCGVTVALYLGLVWLLPKVGIHL